MEKILSGADEDQDQANTQSSERELIEFLSQKNEIDQGYINDCCYSTLLNPHDAKEILKNHNDMLMDKKKLEENEVQFRHEIDQLKTTLNKELQKEQPDIEKITQLRVKQELDA